MTISKELPETFDAGFAFVRLGRDPAFRRHLRDIGWRNDQDVIMVGETETIEAVLTRISTNASSSPCLIAVPMESEPFGFGLMFAGISTHSRWRRRPHQIDIAPSASIGMLYSSLRPCGEYIPSEWVKPVLFERRVA